MNDGYAYLRVSDEHRQRDGFSLETQEREIREYARAHGIRLLHVFIDLMSGRRDDRPQYQQLLSVLKRGDVVLVFKLVRIGRDNAERFRLYKDLDARGVELTSVTEPHMTHELMRGIMTVFDSWFLKQLADQVKPAMLTRARDGLANGPPPRFFAIGPDGKFVPGVGAERAQAIWEYYLATRSVNACVRRFDIPRSTLIKMFRNPAYVGDYYWGGETIPNNHPAIVDRATWQAVDACFVRPHGTGQRRERRDSALLTGLLYLHDSDVRLYLTPRPWVFKGGTRKGEETIYWQYTTAGKADIAPYYFGVRQDVIEEYAVNELANLGIPEGYADEVMAAFTAQTQHDPYAEERAAVERAIRDLDAERLRAARLLSQNRIDDTTYDALRAAHLREEADLAHRRATLPPALDPTHAMRALTMRVNLRENVEEAWERREIAALRTMLFACFLRFEAGYDERPLPGRRKPPLVLHRVYNPAVVIEDAIT